MGLGTFGISVTALSGVSVADALLRQQGHQALGDQEVGGGEVFGLAGGALQSEGETAPLLRVADGTDVHTSSSRHQILVERERERKREREREREI